MEVYTLLFARHNDSPGIIIPALTTLSNIISNPTSQVEGKELLPRVFQLVSHNKRAIRKIAYKIIADLVIHSQEHLTLFLVSPELLEQLKNIAEKESGDVLNSHYTNFHYSIDLGKTRSSMCISQHSTSSFQRTVDSTTESIWLF